MSTFIFFLFAFSHQVTLPNGVGQGNPTTVTLGELIISSPESSKSAIKTNSSETRLQLGDGVLSIQIKQQSSALNRDAWILENKQNREVKKGVFKGIRVIQGKDLIVEKYWIQPNYIIEFSATKLDEKSYNNITLEWNN